MDNTEFKVHVYHMPSPSLILKAHDFINFMIFIAHVVHLRHSHPDTDGVTLDASGAGRKNRILSSDIDFEPSALVVQ